MKRFGTFEGVFTPSLLSILGVIMYLRLGWVLGNAGFAGTLAIILIANIITLATALSMSSIVTNIRIGAGGAYSVISQSLGRRVGGAIGVPLYLSQVFSIAFYIAGFTIAWSMAFPGHSPVIVGLVTWSFLLFISYISTKLAFRFQFIIMAVIGLSLVSFFMGRGTEVHSINILSGMHEVSFWKAFAIFFPAVTGVLAGAGMSGELKEPKRSIPVGTLSAMGVSFIIYMAITFWFASNASMESLANNPNLIIDISRWKWIVIAGIMGATLSSALAMFVTSPRTLLALGKHEIVPFSSSFAKINKNREPGVAILFTSFLVLIVILFGTLDSIAVLITMFFLITYGMINLSVFFEQLIGISSFRPSFRIPLFISLLGAVGCMVTMLLINPVFTVAAVMIIIFTYVLLLRKDILDQGPDIRSGLFQFFAESAAKVASRLPYHPKIWKPNLLVPIDNPREWTNLLQFVSEVTLPRGRIIAFNVIKEGAGTRDEIESRRKGLDELISPLTEKGIFVSSTVVKSGDFVTGTCAVMDMMKAMFFPSNVIFMTLGDDSNKDPVIRDIIAKASDDSLGVIILKLNPKMAFGHKKMINFWVREKSPNVNLSILIALQLEKNWGAGFRIIQVVENDAEKERAEEYLGKLKNLMRMPAVTELQVMGGGFQEALVEAPAADINIFGMSDVFDPGTIRDTESKVNTSVLFIRDSKLESALA